MNGTQKRKLESEWTHTLSVRVLDSDLKGEEKGEGMVVHPLVLGKRSKFFGCLDDNGRQELEFSVPGGMRMFSILIEYLYSGALLQPLDTESSVILFYLAFKYDVAALMDLCRSWWSTHCFRRSPLQITLRPTSQKEPENDVALGKGGVEWCRINRRLLDLLHAIHRRPPVLEVFARVTQVDNSVRDELLGPDGENLSKPILELAWLHLALQIWSECHRGPDRNPLILHGASHRHKFNDLMEEINVFLPPDNPLLLLKPLQLVELRKLGPIITAGPEDGGRSVYRLSRLAPMSREARSFVSRCQLGHELGKRIYSIDQLPSITASVAASLFGQHLQRSKISLDLKMSMDNLLSDLFAYLGPKVTISQMLELMISCASEKVVEMGEKVVEMCEKVAILSAFGACDLLLNWDCGAADVFQEFQFFCQHQRGLWSESSLKLLLDTGCRLALARQHSFSSLRDTLSASLSSCQEQKEDVVVNGACRDRYERMCICLLETFMPHEHEHDTRAAVLCKYVRFEKFKTHDRSWDLLHQMRAQMIDDKIVVEMIDEALKRHCNLTLASVKRWCTTTDKSCQDTLLRILTSEGRDFALLERAKERYQQQNDHWFVGQVIDVSDVEYWSGRWCPCEVLAVRTATNTASQHIYVKYIGWSSSYNRWIDTGTEAHRLAPLGTHSTERALYGIERPPPSPRPIVPPIPAPLTAAGQTVAAAAPPPAAAGAAAGAVIDEKSDDEDYDDWD